MQLPSNNWFVNSIHLVITKEAHERAAGPNHGVKIVLDSWQDFANYVLNDPIVVPESWLDSSRKDKRKVKPGMLRGYSIAQYKDNHRLGANIIESYAMGIDVDDTTLSREELTDALQKLGHACMWHTTLSHTPERPRYRIIFPLAEPCMAHMGSSWNYLLTKLTEELSEFGITADPAAKNRDRFWYWPACMYPAEYAYEVISGSLLELSDPEPVTQPAPSAQPRSASPAYTLQWLHNQLSEYINLAPGTRDEWIGRKGMMLGGLYASRAFDSSLSKEAIIETVHNYVMHNSHSSRQSEYNKVKRAFEAGERRPLEPKKKKVSVTRANINKENVNPIKNTVMLQTTRTNTVKKNMHNYRLMLAASPLGKNIIFDDFSSQVLVQNPKGYREIDECVDFVQLNLWIGSTGNAEDWPDIPKEAFFPLLEELAKLRRVNVERERIEKIKWDGVPRLDTMAVRYLGAEDTELNRKIVKQTMISLIARMCSETPVEVHTMLVLEGAQGSGKTSFVKALGGEKYVAYTGKCISDRSTYITLKRALVVEAGELGGLKRSELEDFKAFMSMSENVFEPKYRSTPVRETRRFILIGTTNENEYLHDQTGNRRFLPIHCGNIKVTEFKEDRDQILAEAFNAWNHGEKWWFEGEEDQKLLKEVHEARVIVSDYLDPIQDYLARRASEPMSTAMILRDILHINEASWGRRLSNEIAGVMRTLGYKLMNTKVLGKQKKIWLPILDT